MSGRGRLSCRGFCGVGFERAGVQGRTLTSICGCCGGSRASVGLARAWVQHAPKEVHQLTCLPRHSGICWLDMPDQTVAPPQFLSLVGRGFLDAFLAGQECKHPSGRLVSSVAALNLVGPQPLPFKRLCPMHGVSCKHPGCAAPHQGMPVSLCVLRVCVPVLLLELRVVCMWVCLWFG